MGGNGGVRSKAVRVLPATLNSVPFAVIIGLNGLGKHC